MDLGFIPVGRERSYRIQAVNELLDHGSLIHEVFGSGSCSASSTVSHPAGSAIDRNLPLRAIHRN